MNENNEFCRNYNGHITGIFGLCKENVNRIYIRLTYWHDRHEISNEGN